MQEIMHIPLSKLTNQQYQEQITELSKIRAPKTVKNVHTLIYAAIQESCDTIHFKVKLPASKKYDYAIPNVDDLSKILQASRNTPLELPVFLAAWLGLRMSEIRAIRREDISGNVLHISSAIVTIDGKPVRKSPKSYTSDRKLKLPDCLIDMLNAADLPIGLSDKAIYNRFIRMCNKLNLSSKYRFHDLRHAQASIGLAIGIPDKYMQERLGHATQSFLVSTYQHTIQERTDTFANQIDNCFFKLINANKNANESQNASNTNG